MSQNYYRAHGLREPRLNDKTFHCPIPGCGRRLYPTVTKSGARKDQTHLKCYNLCHKNFGPAFWYYFEALAPIASGSSFSASTPSTSSHPPNPPVLPSTSGHRKCSWLQGCESIRVNRLCSNHSTIPVPNEQPNTILKGPSLEAIIRAVQEYSSSYSSAPRHNNTTRQSEMAPDLAAAIAHIPSPSPSPPCPRHLSSSASGISFAVNTTELSQRSAVLIQWTENLCVPLYVPPHLLLPLLRCSQLPSPFLIHGTSSCTFSV
ncbi:hypothetical protein B0H13DRAFT_2346028 [Mycena leptocephala]|nr:hypothetical protein B0H13DRAFT_2346028 [Mycena leptocephala]